MSSLDPRETHPERETRPVRGLSLGSFSRNAERVHSVLAEASGLAEAPCTAEAALLEDRGAPDRRRMAEMLAPAGFVFLFLARKNS